MVGGGKMGFICLGIVQRVFFLMLERQQPFTEGNPKRGNLIMTKKARPRPGEKETLNIHVVREKSEQIKTTM